MTVAVSDSPCDAMDTSSGPDLNGFLCIQGNHEVSSHNSRHCFSNASVVKEPGGLMPETLMVRDACEYILEHLFCHASPSSHLARQLIIFKPR